jgi:ribosomal protein L11 methyltransferase
LSPPIVRLGIRVRAERAELALADLLPLLAGGAEERAVDGAVEYALYAPAAELPSRAEIAALAGDSLVDVVTEPVADGWERRWHEYLRPVRAGSLVVRPPWIDGGPGDLVIDPGVFFGAGTHPTTRLCLELLQALEPGGPLCDWGAGTGVLAIAAARLGWDPVTAVEIEPAALPVIAANAARNDVTVTAVEGDRPRGAPTVVANLPRPALLALAERRRRAHDGVGERPGRLVASGFLAAETDEIVAALERRELQRRAAAGWGAVVLA